MIKIGMIGTGGIARLHLEKMESIPYFKLIAVAEINEEKAKECSEKYGVPYYIDYKEMCEKEDVDAVIITLPHFLHCESSVFCLERGIHVLCEKPMANTSEECDMMIAASKKSGAKLAVAHPHTFVASYNIIKEFIKNKKLGELVMINEVRNEPYFLPTRPRWFLNKKMAGGGIVMNFGAHSFDKVSFVLGSDFQNINAICGNLFSNDDIEGHAQIYFTANGVPCSVTLCGYDTYYSNQSTYIFTNGALRTGGKTELEICDGKDPQYGPYNKDFVPYDFSGFSMDTFRCQLLEFAKLCRGEESILPDGKYGKRIIEAIEMVYEKSLN